MRMRCRFVGISRMCRFSSMRGRMWQCSGTALVLSVALAQPLVRRLVGVLVPELAPTVAGGSSSALALAPAMNDYPSERGLREMLSACRCCCRLW